MQCQPLTKIKLVDGNKSAVHHIIMDHSFHHAQSEVHDGEEFLCFPVIVEQFFQFFQQPFHKAVNKTCDPSPHRVVGHTDSVRVFIDQPPDLTKCCTGRHVGKLFQKPVAD